ncbi:hypothetical protein [Streptomyces sp. NPDC051214]|uniref:hypothetical protein n=1 Tax=Streptomyces sp. NPDC051214 TaxID=3155282 RepID=UPI00341F59AF
MERTQAELQRCSAHLEDATTTKWSQDDAAKSQMLQEEASLCLARAGEHLERARQATITLTLEGPPSVVAAGGHVDKTLEDWMALIKRSGLDPGRPPAPAVTVRPAGPTGATPISATDASARLVAALDTFLGAGRTALYPNVYLDRLDISTVYATVGVAYQAGSCGCFPWPERVGGCSSRAFGSVVQHTAAPRCSPTH